MKTIRPFGTFGTFGTRGLILILAAALGISFVVGFASPAFAEAYRGGAVIVNPDGKVTYLGTLGGTETGALDINDSGQVVGSALTAGGTYHAFLWQDGTMTDLGTFGGSLSAAFAINEERHSRTGLTLAPLMSWSTVVSSLTR